MPSCFRKPQSLSLWLCLVLACVAGRRAKAGPAAPHAERFVCLQAGYPGHVLALQPDPATGRLAVMLQNGRMLPWDDGVRTKTFEQRLAAPDLEDMLAQPYPVGPQSNRPALDEDPGRIRVIPFLMAIYGATAAEVRDHLEPVVWLPRHGGRILRFNRKNGAAAALQRVSHALDALPDAQRRFAETTGGTFNWRAVHGTDRLSAHAFAIAVDINVAGSDYWRWAKAGGGPRHPPLPAELVAIFEAQGFVWGGKWYHYDTMHFEYRPELLQPVCRARPHSGPLPFTSPSQAPGSTRNLCRAPATVALVRR